MEGRIRNCQSWSHAFDLDGGFTPTSADDGFGFGSVAARSDTASDYVWVGKTGAYCENRFKLPLLCLEHPGS